MGLGTSPNSYEVCEIRAEPWNIALTEPFGIATGAQYEAKNVLVTVVLADGTMGLGEAAPFPAVNGETQEDALQTVRALAGSLRGVDASRFRHLASLVREATVSSPSARAAIESAALDAFLRQSGLPLWRFFGGAEETLETDITIVTGTADHARSAAARAAAGGFRILKVKVGGSAIDLDVARVNAILEAAPNARLVVDANASLTAEEAIELVERVDSERIALFEQPTAPEDLEGMRAVRRRTRVKVAADESARSSADVARLALERAADVVNVKITKTGIAEALDIIAAARSFSMELMIGGMVESPLAMGVSACLAAGQGGFAFVDLDTPFFMKDLPTRGGYSQDGPRITVSHIDRGHGVTVP